MMIVVGLPFTEQRLRNLAEITGGTPYGATTLAGIDGSRQPTENELAYALSGQACRTDHQRTDHQRTDRRPQNSGLSLRSLVRRRLD
jgi:hypothetical protein